MGYLVEKLFGHKGKHYKRTKNQWEACSVLSSEKCDFSKVFLKHRTSEHFNITFAI